MQITIDTNNLSELDLAMLGFLAGNTDEVEPEPVVEVKKTPVKKAPVKVAANAEPDTVVDEPVEDDLLGTDGPVLADAVAAATALVSTGEAARVKSALAAVGVKRVSELSAPADIAAFITALEA